MSASPLPSFTIHCQAKTAPASPSASSIPSAEAVNVAPTNGVPAIAGWPAGSVLATGVAFVTAWRENPAAALPAESRMRTDASAGTV